MKVLGIDFTSAPSRNRPITVATGELVGGMLRIQSVRGLPSFEEFEAEIGAPGPWTAGIDFPFGQPAVLVRALGWPLSWSRYVSKAGSMERGAFVSMIEAYSSDQPDGEKRLKRRTDQEAGSESPMNCVRPPVCKMFIEGAPRILRSGACIVPCAQNEDPRIILEAYPALVAKALAETRSYKQGNSPHQIEERRNARAEIVSELASYRCVEIYGLAVCLEQADRERIVRDQEADLLDAVLCAVQAAWASSRKDMGIPDDCDPLEGWIVDPSLLTVVEAQPLAVRELSTTQKYSANLLDRITTNPLICHGKPCIRGLRYPVDSILELLSSGMTTDEILGDYDDLEQEDILAVFAYAVRMSRIKRLQTLDS